MRKNFNLLWAGLLPVMLFFGCGRKEEEKEEKKDDESVSVLGAAKALKEMSTQAEKMQKDGPVQTVDFRSLKELLPANVDGLARKEASGEKNGTAGFSFSVAKGEYANDDKSETIELSIADGGSSMVLMGLAAWSMVEMDKETENGYEKTSKIGDNKSYEKYDNSNKSGEVAVIINKRFVVTANGHGVSMDKIKAAIEAVDIDKLADLK